MGGPVIYYSPPPPLFWGTSPCTSFAYIGLQDSFL